MRVIILAAGQGLQLDGYNKLLIQDPLSGKNILDKYLEAFAGMKITIVLGYRSINVMHKYPKLEYIYNRDWAVWNNSYSLSLAITEEPTFVISGDLMIEPNLIKAMKDSGPNIVASRIRDSRTIGALNMKIENNIISEVYEGKLRDINDPEAVGIYKITSSSILRSWKKKCIENKNLFIGQNLPFQLSDTPIESFDIGDFRFDEVNNPLDYIKLLEAQKI